MNENRPGGDTFQAIKPDSAHISVLLIETLDTSTSQRSALCKCMLLKSLVFLVVEA